MNEQRLAAFALDGKGGNPAGVVIAPYMPPEVEMQQIAAEIGYSETAFASPEGNEWRVRYFAPESEVPFCGHATIALGAALAEKEGDGEFTLQLNEAKITVAGHRSGSEYMATLMSPETASKAANDELRAEVLDLFSLADADLDTRFEVTFASAGATHILIFLKDRERLAEMSYDFEAGKALMRRADLVTIALIWIETQNVFHVRNAFASGGVVEDPATGAAAAALSGYLRDVGWEVGNGLTIIQGEDMGVKSLIRTEFAGPKGSPVSVSGAVRKIHESET